MKVKKITLYKYCLPLKKELSIKRHLISAREGVLIKIYSDNDSISLGEVSPLPCLHHENLSKAIKELRSLSQILPGKDLGDILKYEMASSVRYGLEMAERHSGFSELIASLKKNSNVFMPVCALAFAGSPNSKEEIRKIIDEGYKSIKIKVGRSNMDQEIEAVNHLSHIISNEKRDISLRIDANSSWDLRDAVRFGKNIDKRYVQYIEDPVKKMKEYAIFFKETDIPIALDEKLEDFEKEYDLHANMDYLKAVIIKPNYIGGFSKAAEIISAYKKKKITCVLSNSFETGLSISSIMLFAYKMGLADVAIGIDTLKYFKHDILKNKFIVKEGCMDLAQINIDISNIDFSIMEKIQ